MKIYQIDKDVHQDPLRALFWEYLVWGAENLKAEYGIEFDIDTSIEEDMKGVEKFLPPKGCLLVAELDGIFAGTASLKILIEGIGEIKRMYVRPDYRRRGIARDLLKSLLIEAKTMELSHIRLDSARFMQNAHQLYRSFGFREIEPYAGSEIPEEFREHWIFMELPLDKVRTGN